MHGVRTAMVSVGFLNLLLVATGCSTYTIKGIVVRGEVSSIEFVEPLDHLLRQSPVKDVRLTVQRDPAKPNRRMVGTDVSDVHGRFVISLDEFGAGWMEEKWLIRATRAGFKTSSAMQHLDSSKKKMLLLVTLEPGISVVPRDDEDLLEEFRRYK